MGEELYQVRWQHFQDNIRDNFRELRGGAELQDVTLHVGGQVVGAHKVVLATISPYFHRLLTSLPPHTATHPLLLMPKDVTHEEVLRMLDYIYYGEVSLPAREVPRFLEVAAQFQVSETSVFALSFFSLFTSMFFSSLSYSSSSLSSPPFLTPVRRSRG